MAKRFLRTVLLACLMTMAFGAEAIDIAAGQIWEYRTRPTEQASLLKIVKIDKNPKLGTIYHITVVDVKIKVAEGQDAYQSTLQHVPVSRVTLDKSLTRLSKRIVPFPDYRRGYTEWKTAFDKGEAGVFSVPVSEIVADVEKTYAARRPVNK